MFWTGSKVETPAPKNPSAPPRSYNVTYEGFSEIYGVAHTQIVWHNNISSNTAQSAAKTKNQATVERKAAPSAKTAAGNAAATEKVNGKMKTAGKKRKPETAATHPGKRKLPLHNERARKRIIFPAREELTPPVISYSIGATHDAVKAVNTFMDKLETFEFPTADTSLFKDALKSWLILDGRKPDGHAYALLVAARLLHTGLSEARATDRQMREAAASGRV